MSSMPRPGIPPPMPVGIPMPPGSFVGGRMPMPGHVGVPPGAHQFGAYHRPPPMPTPSMPPEITSAPMLNPSAPITSRAPPQHSIAEANKPSATTQSSTSSAPAKKTSAWSEHKAPDGRVYYYNSSTRQSAWTKPDELLTPAERLLAQCPWKEYRAADSGKTYYHNVSTRESRWIMPKELEEVKVRVAILESESCGDEEVAPVAPSSSTSASNSTETGESAKKSALELAMAATLAAIDIPPPGQSGGAAAAAEASSGESSEEDSDNAESSNRETAKPTGKPSDTQPTTEPQRVFKDKREAIEAFKDLLRDKNVPARSTWEQALRLIQPDPRYQTLRRLNEKKQVFNQYKTQRFKEEREEQRQKAKQARTDLEQFLINGDRITSGTRYYRCEELFADMPVWKAVPEEERREIHNDVIFALASQEKESAKKLRRRNMHRLAELLNSMMEITCDTTWQHAQHILLDNPSFAEDTSLLGMDKEDALIAFEQHIRQLEADVDEEKQVEEQRRTRSERKNRDSFILLLDQLHEQGKLTSMSLWVELYPVISADLRFTAMLGQPGSTPLDLFKFYVEDLKSRFHDEKKIIKEILKEKGFEVQVTTTFEEFATVVCEDRRSATMDAGNVKLTYNSLLEKAESRERERCKDDARKQRKLQSAYTRALRSAGVTHTDEWTAVRARLENDPAFQAVELESERVRIFNDYQHRLVESCAHNHAKTHKKKKSKSSGAGGKKRRSRSRSRSRSESRSRSRSRSRSAESTSGGGGGGRRKRRARDKPRRSRSSSGSGGDDRGSDSGGGRRRRHRGGRRHRDSDGSGDDR